LCNKNDLILADKSVHASIIDGIKLCSAETKRYRHKDYEHLIKLIEKHYKNKDNIFIVSESIFSMDGDIADLKKLVDIKNKYNAILYIDEAHAVGTRGDNGLGYSEELSLINDIDIIVGTFGKALASQGAFVICNNVIKEYLINTSRSLIYTTALPPINVAWTNFIVEKLPSFSEERKRLKEYSKIFCETLNLEIHESNIIPIILGENNIALRFAKKLQQQGFFVLPIRHPTVPKETARLRFSLKADLKETEIINAANILKSFKQEQNIL
jgi:8-amino-7-oxononanoate synthase